jgi:hypothetical protein
VNEQRRHDRAVARAARLNPRQREVLIAVAAGSVQRGILYGDFEPYRLAGRSVGWHVRMLRLRMLVALPPLSPPQLTRLGEATVQALTEEGMITSTVTRLGPLSRA